MRVDDAFLVTSNRIGRRDRCFRVHADSSSMWPNFGASTSPDRAAGDR